MVNSPSCHFSLYMLSLLCNSFIIYLMFRFVIISLDRNLFGLPLHMMKKVEMIGTETLLFLYNKDERVIHGIFLADGEAGLNIEPEAYAPRSFPAQIRMQQTRVRATIPASNLSWRIKFGTLDASQVEELCSALQEEKRSETSNMQQTGKTHVMPLPKAVHKGKKSHLFAANKEELLSTSFFNRSSKNGSETATADQINSNSASASSERGNLPIPPETVVLDLLISRLEMEIAALKAERRSMSSPHRENCGDPPKAWPIRYGVLEDQKTKAVASGQYLVAAALKQQIAHLKGMLEAVAAHHQTIDQISENGEARHHAIQQAISQEDYLAAALLLQTNETKKMRTASKLRRGSVKFPSKVGWADTEESLRSIIEGDLSLAADVTIELMKNGICCQSSLRTVTKEQLLLMEG